MESCSPDSLAAPPPSLPSHNPLLGRFSRSPTEFCQNSSQFHRQNHNLIAPSQSVTNTTEFTQECNLPTSPSPLQKAALAVLQEVEDQVALAWLTGLRSLRSGENHWFQPGSLSSEQFKAISVLKDCPDDLVCLWLDFTRRGGAFDGPQRLSSSSHLGTRTASAAQLHNSWQGSSSTSRSSTGSFGALRSLYDNNTVPTTPTSSRSRDTFLDLSTETSIDEVTQSFSASHSHWCFICPNPRVITTCDGWKRHMKEHDTRYRCMPRGPIENTAEGTKCAFCGFRNPSQSHCDIHKAFPCANRSLDVRSYTRKPHFVSHLKTHDILDAAGLANHWRDTNNKKHFSCGFCVSHFHSLIEQLGHIDIAHFRLFQHIRDWDSNKVIRGLLLQTEVSESWRRILASRPGLMESHLHWDLSVTKKLQYRLQVGIESADILAESAFNESTYNSSYHSEAEMVNATGLSNRGGITAAQQNEVTQATVPLHLNLNEESIGNGNLTTSSASHMEHWSATNNSLSLHNYSTARCGSDMSSVDPALDTRQPHLDTSQQLLIDGTDYQTQAAPRLSTPYASYKSPDSNLATPNGSIMGNYWQGTPILSPTNSSMLPDQPKYQSQRSMVKSRPRYANQILPPNSVPKASPLTQSSAILAKPSPLSQPRKQPSRSKLKDYYDINTEAEIDLDMDNLQHLMREEDSTRSERRRH